MKKLRIIFFVFIIVFSLFSGFSFCSAAWKLNVDYPPNIPLAPHLDANSRLPAFILYFYAAGIYLVGALAVLSLVIAGIQFIMSAENPSTISAAKERMRSSAIGLAIVLGAALLGQTIHMQYVNLGITLDIKEPKGVLLVGTSGKIAAPARISDISKYGKYDIIDWPLEYKDINGKGYDNCDKNTYAWLIYWYKNTDFGKVEGASELKCGQHIALSTGSSYIMSKEVPGVYFFPEVAGNAAVGKGTCLPTLDSDETPPEVHTASNPFFKTKQGMLSNEDINCVRIVNGSSIYSGPFFGVVYFNQKNYYGDMFQHLAPPLKANERFDFSGGSFHIQKAGSQAAASFIIYKNMGKALSGRFWNAGYGVTLYQREGKSGGYYYISGTEVAGTNQPWWQRQLSTLKVNYENTKVQVPKDERILCNNFIDNDSKEYCLKSMKIDGNFLVLLSETRDWAMERGLYSTQSEPGLSASHPAQAFPRNNVLEDEIQEDIIFGPNKLQIESIGFNAKYILIIPLAESPYMH